MSPASPSPVAGPRNELRIAFYYVVVVAVVAVVIARFPDVARLLTLGLDDLGASNPAFDDAIRSTLGAGAAVSDDIPRGWDSVWLTAASLLGALALMVPVALTYILIKRRTGYDESVVHTLLILPVVVTGVVMIVGQSLALAFSLAGIVAAVRFRTTLDDTKDAVYVFLAIGVGLAAGVQALGVALALSLVFSALNLVLWRLNFGNVYVDQLRRTGGGSLGSAVAGADSGALAFGDDRLMSALSPKDLREVAERQARMASYLRQESRERKERKRYFVLMVYTTSAGEAQPAVEAALAELCVRWHLAEILPGEGGVSVLEYLARPEDGVSEAQLLEGVRRAGGDTVRAAELRSLKKLAQREA